LSLSRRNFDRWAGGAIDSDMFFGGMNAAGCGTSAMDKKMVENAKGHDLLRAFEVTEQAGGIRDIYPPDLPTRFLD
jgi:hypothetical protein